MSQDLHSSGVDERPSRRLEAVSALAALRSAVGLGSWMCPSLTWRAFGLGSPAGDPRATVITRLFGIRELALAQAVRHPNPEVRRAALQAGVAVDAIDIVASLVAVRRGAPKVILLTFVAGAALFVGLGVAGLAEAQVPVPEKVTVC